MNTDKTMVAKGFGEKNFPILNKGNQVARCEEGEIGVPNRGPRAVKGWSQSWNIAKMQIVGDRKEVILLRVVEEPVLGSRGLTRKTFSLGGGGMVKEETELLVKKRSVRS
ncbi:hypothetical protein TNCV_315261 [Trichonephila clavipes]|nr:hypothetical protein TNCV_315261 [Trichonephila clavipes]